MHVEQVLQLIVEVPVDKAEQKADSLSMAMQGQGQHAMHSYAKGLQADRETQRNC